MCLGENPWEEAAVAAWEWGGGRECGGKPQVCHHTGHSTPNGACPYSYTHCIGLSVILFLTVAQGKSRGQDANAGYDTSLGCQPELMVIT